MMRTRPSELVVYGGSLTSLGSRAATDADAAVGFFSQPVFGSALLWGEAVSSIAVLVASLTFIGRLVTGVAQFIERRRVFRRARQAMRAQKDHAGGAGAAAHDSHERT